MAESVKGVKGVKGDYVTIRVVMPKSTYRALRVKCALMDMTVRKGIIDIIDRSVKGVRKDVEAIKAKV